MIPVTATIIFRPTDERWKAAMLVTRNAAELADGITLGADLSVSSCAKCPFARGNERDLNPAVLRLSFSFPRALCEPRRRAFRP